MRGWSRHWTQSKAESIAVHRKSRSQSKTHFISISLSCSGDEQSRCDPSVDVSGLMQSRPFHPTGRLREIAGDFISETVTSLAFDRAQWGLLTRLGSKVSVVSVRPPTWAGGHKLVSVSFRASERGGVIHHSYPSNFSNQKEVRVPVRRNRKLR